MSTGAATSAAPRPHLGTSAAPRLGISAAGMHLVARPPPHPHTSSESAGYLTGMYLVKLGLLLTLIGGVSHTDASSMRVRVVVSAWRIMDMKEPMLILLRLLLRRGLLPAIAAISLRSP